MSHTRTWKRRLHGSTVRLAIAITVAIATTAALPGGWSWVLRSLGGWSAGMLVYLAIAWRMMLCADADTTRRYCRTEDQNRGMIDMLLLLVSGASIVAVCVALREASTPGGPGKIVSVGVPIVAAVLAWLLVHTIYALHYARLFYHNDEDPDGPPTGGFDLHQDDAEPDYRDFLYIALAVACTFGVTDTELTSKPVRRTVMWHALLAFAFATIVLALAVNVITNLLSSGG